MELVRSHFGTDSTLGKLYDASDGERTFLCYTLEDQVRIGPKVPGETAIPYGTYPLAFRKEGGFHGRYLKRFGEMHRGMIELRNVPGFKWILIHCGNTHGDSAGCLLVGSDYFHDGDNFKLVQSEKAYRSVYPLIAGALSRGERVVLHVPEVTP